MGKSLKGKELGRGITQRKDGLYQGSFVDKKGKRRTMYGKTLTDISKKLSAARYEDEHGVHVTTSKATLDEWFEVWLETIKVELRDTTKRTYRTLYRHISKELGYLRLGDLTVLNVQRAFNSIESDSMRVDCRTLLVDILNRAVEADLVTKNPASLVKVKTDTRPRELDILSIDESARLEKALACTTIGPLVGFMLETGLRIGEATALMWPDICEDGRSFVVNRTLVYIPGKGNSFHEPKTSAGRRVIPLTKKARSILDDQPRTNDLIFPTRNGTPFAEANVKNMLYMYEQRAGIDKHVGPHGLRHTFATRCIAAGMKPKVLQKILGHKKLATTMDIYCHVEDDTLRSEMALLGEMA